MKLLETDQNLNTSSIDCGSRSPPPSTSVHDGTEQDGNEASLTTANPTNASADITHPPSPLIVRGGSLVCDNSMRSSTSGQDVEHDAGSGNICEDEGASAGSEEKASPSPGDIAPVPIDQEILDADDGKQIHHARSVKAQKIKDILRSAEMRLRLLELHARRPVYEPPTTKDRVELTTEGRVELTEVSWPAHV
ncbi:hypothetical protein L914_04662 [Phytophthora nicotianae]|uniref:Uncharacterized protein n=1 Tax=Phytophthora nicotianae TaxID=4792 RepID=W2NS73_PHYNI|nr:hypothetical protein L914_04662 [Phytophthora nicotianae]